MSKGDFYIIMKNIRALFFSCAITLTFFLSMAMAAPEDNQTESAVVEDGGTLKPDEAMAMLLDEANKGNTKAMLTVGSLYERGYGSTNRNFGKALEWYLKAANGDLPEGYYNVGVSYEIGLGTAPDLAKAKEYFIKASTAGMAQADFKLAIWYLTGQGEAPDQSKGLEYLNKSADGGYPIAINELGVIYNQGLWGQEKDNKKAFDMFVKASEAGMAEAMKNLAVLFYTGQGQPKNLVKALKWYMLANSSGFNSPDIEAILEQIKSELKPEEITKAEKEAQTWLTNKLATPKTTEAEKKANN